MLEMGYGLEDMTVKRAAENLMNYQLPGGAYMHPKGRKVNLPNSKIGWAACITGYVTHALIHLGFQKDPRVKTSLNVMLNKQRKNGGWICDTVGKDCPYCIKSGVPWVFRCLAEAELIDKKSPITKQVLKLINRHKKKIISHGYQRDNYYRCDEALLLPGLNAIGLSDSQHLVRDFRQSLINKQQPDGSWQFRGKSSPWYTIEVLAALGNKHL